MRAYVNEVYASRTAINTHAYVWQLFLCAYINYNTNTKELYYL